MDYWFLDSYDKYIGAFLNNGSLMIYDISMTFDRKVTYSINHSVSSYNRLNSTFVYYSQDDPLFVSSFTCTNYNFPDMS